VPYFVESNIKRIVPLRLEETFDEVQGVFLAASQPEPDSWQTYSVGPNK